VPRVSLPLLGHRIQGLIQRENLPVDLLGIIGGETARGSVRTLNGVMLLRAGRSFGGVPGKADDPARDRQDQQSGGSGAGGSGKSGRNHGG
jgi:hypothetical protein